MNPDLSFALRQRDHDDPALLQAVIQQMYTPVTQIAAGLAENLSDISSLRQEAFQVALRKIEAYPAGTDFYLWFLRTAVRQLCMSCLRMRRRQMLKRFGLGRRSQHSDFSRRRNEDHEPGQYLIWRPGWPAVPFDSKIAFLLRFLLGISVPDIAEILGKRERYIRKSLIRSVWILGRETGQEEALSGRSQDRFSHRRKRIQLLDRETLTEADQQALERHLENCDRCRSFYDRLVRLQSMLASDQENLIDRIAEGEIESFAHQILDSWNTRPRRTFRGSPLREITWIVLAVPIFLGIGWIFSRANARAELQAAIEAQRLAAANKPIEDSPERTNSITSFQEAPQETIGGGALESSWSPKISADGRWVVFASTLHRLVDDDTNEASDIFVHDRVTGAVKRVSLDSQRNQANNSSFEPDISGDGRYIVFTSWANNLAAGDSLNCELWGTQSSCPDIFLHDSHTGETTLISKNPDGQPGDNFSFAPSISGNGRWIAFWSLATDLVEGDTAPCLVSRGGQDCLDAYLFDRLQNRFHRIPVQRNMNDPTPKNHDLILSADGQELLIMLDADDQIASELQFNGAFEIFLYRPAARQLEPVNVTPDGDPGNGPAYAASISSDGRWAVFATRASNLVSGDQNGMIDLYVRDLDSGEIQRVGQPADGAESDGNSGVTAVNGGNFSEGLSISGDGAWVFFSSAARNLLPGQEVPSCSFFGPTCQNVYLLERRTGQIQQINSTNIDWIAFTSISADARWMSFLANSENCNLNEFCNDIYLYDRESDSVGSLDSFGVGPTDVSPGPRLIDGLWMLDLHDNWATSVAFSPSGLLMASGSRDGDVNLWSLEENESITTLTGHADGASSIAFSPDGETLAVGSLSGRAYLWRVPEGNLIGLMDGEAEIRALTYTPNGTQLVISTKDGVRIWDLNASEWTLAIGNHEMKPRGISVSTDGVMLAVASDDQTVRIFELATGRPLLRLGGHESGVNAAAFSSNGDLLATAGDDGRVNVWALSRDAESNVTARLRYRFTHNDWVTTVSFSSDADVLATGSFDSKVGVWDLRTGALLDVPFNSTQNQVLDLAISPDNHSIALSTVRGEVVLWLELGMTGG